MSSIFTKLERNIRNAKDEAVRDLLDECLSVGAYAVNINPDYLDILVETDQIPRVYLNIDHLNLPVQNPMTYPYLIDMYKEIMPSVHGFNLPLSGRYISEGLEEIRGDLDIRGWLYYPMAEYSQQVCDFLNNLDQSGYTSLVIATKKDVPIADFIITVSQMQKQITLPIKIFHPGIGVSECKKFTKFFTEHGGIIE